jgi:DNA-binding CsgD family transcriptional regulator
MNFEVNIPLEFLLTGIQAVTVWILFFRLYHQDSRVKRTALLCFLILWRPLHLMAGLFLTLPTAIKVLLEAAAFLTLVFLAGGKKRTTLITAIYLWDTGFLIDVIVTCLFTGFTGSLPFSSAALYLEMTVSQVFMFLWALFYYLLMRTIPEDALNRISLRFWLIALLTPLIGAAVLFANFNPLRIQLEAGYNNFFFCGFIGAILIVLNLFIFYLYIKLMISYHARVLAGELSKTPPVYTPANGLSPEFVEKYELSKRQAEAAEALLQGKSNKEIAAFLNIEVNTVQVHLQNVYRKTGAPGRFALMALVGQGKSV